MSIGPGFRRGDVEGCSPDVGDERLAERADALGQTVSSFLEDVRAA